jgi:hypothetical protein
MVKGLDVCGGFFEVSRQTHGAFTDGHGQGFHMVPELLDGLLDVDHRRSPVVGIKVPCKQISNYQSKEDGPSFHGDFQKNFRKRARKFLLENNFIFLFDQFGSRVISPDS